jgi:phosphate transport system permease protein
MTDTVQTPVDASFHSNDEAKSRLRKRRNAETRLRLYGIIAITLAALALVALLYNIFARTAKAASEHYISVQANIAPDENDFLGVVKDAAKEAFPYATGRTNRRAIYGLFSDGAADDMRRASEEGTLVTGEAVPMRFLMSDTADLYMRGEFGDLQTRGSSDTLSVEAEGKNFVLRTEGDTFADALGLARTELAREAESLRRQKARQVVGIETLEERVADLTGPELEGTLAQIAGFEAARDQFEAKATALDALITGDRDTRLALSNRMPSFFVAANGGILKLTEVSATTALAKPLVPMSETGAIDGPDWSLRILERPEIGRPVKDMQVAILETLKDEGRIEQVANWKFFSLSDSTQPEIAGIKGALIGSAWTMLVTFSLAFPIGVMAAIYLEEFAPRNRWTDFVEVNINNLAAVPSIVFGLLGLAVFINFFGTPRSSPLTGGLVLALMTLPTVIIAARASIRAVPPSIRSAALGLGASRTQTVFHHVLPLAMPGILTGTIIGMAQALGETAPLLIIGMVAFITAVPESITDSATVLPVQVFNWANASERAFDMRTAAAIAVLLMFLVVMNALAIILRKQFERRW